MQAVAEVQRVEDAKPGGEQLDEHARVVVAGWDRRV